MAATASAVFFPPGPHLLGGASPATTAAAYASQPAKPQAAAVGARETLAHLAYPLVLLDEEYLRGEGEQTAEDGAEDAEHKDGVDYVHDIHISASLRDAHAGEAHEGQRQQAGGGQGYREALKALG